MAASYRKRRTQLVRPAHVNGSEAPQYMREALEWCRRMSGARRVLLWRIDRRSKVTECVASSGGSRPAHIDGTNDPLAWAARESVSLRVQPSPHWSDAQQVFAVPVRTIDESEVVATFEIDESAQLASTRFDGLGVYLGGMMSVEAERAQLGAVHAHAGDLIRTLRTLPEAVDADALAAQLARAGADILAATGCTVSTWQRDSGVVLGSYGDAPAVGTRFAAGESETALAVRAATTLQRARGALGTLPLVARAERVNVQPNAFVAVPLKITGDVVGVISAWRQDDIARHRIRDLETLAPYAALQLQHAHELVVMRARAERDPLTGMHNRLAFEEFLGGETARYDRYQRPFALALMDIDYFKKVNDTYGHEAGDAVLQQVSSVIMASLRNVDFAARLGGEEFVVVLPETGIERAVEIVERIRQRVAQQAVEWRGQRIDVRISAGVSALPECVRFANQLLRSADAALYTSKHAGRDRVTHASVLKTV